MRPVSRPTVPDSGSWHPVLTSVSVRQSHRTTPPTHPGTRVCGVPERCSGLRTTRTEGHGRDEEILRSRVPHRTVVQETGKDTQVLTEVSETRRTKDPLPRPPLKPERWEGSRGTVNLHMLSLSFSLSLLGRPCPSAERQSRVTRDDQNILDATINLGPSSGTTPDNLCPRPDPNPNTRGPRVEERSFRSRLEDGPRPALPRPPTCATGGGALVGPLTGSSVSDT